MMQTQTVQQSEFWDQDETFDEEHPLYPDVSQLCHPHNDSITIEQPSIERAVFSQQNLKRKPLPIEKPTARILNGQAYHLMSQAVNRTRQHPQVYSMGPTILDKP
jgi:hypothetical protein